MPENDGLRTNCRPLQRRSPNGAYGHIAEIELFKFVAEKEPLNFWHQEAAGGH